MAVLMVVVVIVLMVDPKDGARRVTDLGNP